MYLPMYSAPQLLYIELEALTDLKYRWPMWVTRHGTAQARQCLGRGLLGRHGPTNTPGRAVPAHGWHTWPRYGPILLGPCWAGLKARWLIVLPYRKSLFLIPQLRGLCLNGWKISLFCIPLVLGLTLYDYLSLFCISIFFLWSGRAGTGMIPVGPCYSWAGPRLWASGQAVSLRPYDHL
jgi:hypothetical protein